MLGTTEEAAIVRNSRPGAVSIAPPRCKRGFVRAAKNSRTSGIETVVRGMQRLQRGKGRKLWGQADNTMPLQELTAPFHSLTSLCEDLKTFLSTFGSSPSVFAICMSSNSSDAVGTFDLCLSNSSSVRSWYSRDRWQVCQLL